MVLPRACCSFCMNFHRYLKVFGRLPLLVDLLVLFEKRLTFSPVQYRCWAKGITSAGSNA